MRNAPIQPMIIKKIELQGFKSFPEKTKILFHPGITAVIGPNGTGKSNIVDALLWVLGGKRFKTLRGERGADIIFNGNEKKAPLGLADVNLYLGDEEEELLISHRLFRSGESEYKLNGKVARLKDIQECLWKKSIGEKEYFVIEQGTIGLFLGSKPSEKRLLVEEAAGTAYYKDKKRQAENKLESSEQNLIRLDDIIDEVSKAKNSLKRQANAALRYRKLRDKIRSLTTLYYRTKIEELETCQKEAADQYEKLLNQENGSASRIKEEERRLASKRKEAWTLESSVNEEQENIFSLRSNLSRLEAVNDQNKKRIDLFEEKKKKAKENLKEASQEASLLEKETTEAAESLKKLKAALTQKERDLKKASEETRDLDERKTLNQETLESLRNEYFRSLSSSTEVKNKRAEYQKELELIGRQEEKITAQQEKEKELLQAVEKKLNREQKEISGHQKQIKENEFKLDIDQKKLEEILTSLHILEDKINGLNEKREKQEQNLKLLQKIEEKERRVDATQDIPESIGFLADLIRIDPEYLPLIDIFWKEEAKAVLIEVQGFLNNLSRRKLKGNFLLLHPQKKEKSLSETYKDPRVLGLLKTHIRADSKVKDFILNLREAAIVKDTKSAVDLWLQFPSLNCITLQGDFLLSSGLLQLGVKKEGLFSLLQEKKKTKANIASLEKAIHPLDLELKEKAKEQQKREEDIKQKSESMAHLEKSIKDKEKEISLIHSEKKKIETSISTLQSELKIARDDKNSMQKRLDSISIKVRQIEKKEEALRKALESGEEESDAYQKKSEEKRKGFFELQSSHKLIREKIKNLRQGLHYLEHRKEILKDKTCSFQKEVQEADKNRFQLQEEDKLLLKKIKTLKDERKRKETELAEDEIDLKNIQKDQKEWEMRINNLRDEHERIKDARVEWEIKKAERDRDLVNLEESCWQELKKSPEEVKAEISPEKIKYRDVQERLEAAKEKLQKYKAVNLMAEEEYLVQKKRYDFLLQQKKDLRDSIDTTKEAIKRIDQEGKAKFSESLKEINKNFCEVFALLFNGGMAEMKLTDENNPLESGVEIVAQPPEKKLQSITLLSGGEKSLTSLAFFFALFRYKPTPFCVLDEVDAALDDVNLKRFLNLMKKIKNQTQFILITHNFKTMEVADYIYGTTMSEPNITTIYSMQLDKNKSLIT